MAADLEALIDDLQAETADLAGVLQAGAREVGGSDGAMTLPTPAAGWTVGDTIGHLWFFDVKATQALADPDGFVAGLAEVLTDPEGYMARHLDDARSLGDDLLPAWHAERERMVAAVRATDPSARVPWYGPPMSPTSFTTARLMETWAHGQDVADALGVTRQATDRLRHVCHLGVRTRGFSYVVRGRTAPDDPVLVTLQAPSGAVWTWGPEAAADRVSGSAEDFCLLVTQRRVLSDLSLEVVGDAAVEWLSIAQAFAGEATLTDPRREVTTAR